MKQRLKLLEVRLAWRGRLNCGTEGGNESIKAPIIFLAVLTDEFDQLSLAWFGDVAGRFVESSIKPLAVLF